jgi:Predicted Na+-dependent transporter
MGIVTTIAPIALALIMLGLGASLTVNDFTRVFQNPKDFFIGIVCQLLLLPVVAYILIIILRTPVELALGVMLIAAAPGGVTSNVLTKFANGDVALSISLTAVTSLISIVSVPYVVFLSIELFDISYVKREDECLVYL